MIALWNARSDRRWATPGSTGSGRQAWAGTVLMLAGTLAISLASYSVSMAVSAERASVDRLARENAALSREMKSLEAEYRVRMRLPQLEKWNRDVLGLRPIDAKQFLDSPLLLASYGTAPVPAMVAPHLAVVRDADAVATQPVPQLRTVAAGRPAPLLPDDADVLDPELLAAVAALGNGADGAQRPSPSRLTQVALDDAAMSGDVALVPAGSPVRR